MRKRIRSACKGLVIAALCLSLGACTPLVEKAPESLNIYATFYPLYAIADMLTENIPNLQLNCLVQPQDGCLRDYALSDWDLYLLTYSADAVIAGGRGLEAFESTLFALGDSGPAVAEILYNQDLYKNGERADDESESHFYGENPHIYLTIDGAIGIAESAAAQLAALDPKYNDTYVHNLDKAVNRLESLRTQMHETSGDLSGKRAIVLNEALIYVAQEYSLDVAGWYDRDSGEAFYDTELEKCLAALKDMDAQVVLIEKQAPENFCAALTAAGFTVAKLDILSTRRADEGSEGYFTAQKSNAAALAEAFFGENNDE